MWKTKIHKQLRWLAGLYLFFSAPPSLAQDDLTKGDTLSNPVDFPTLSNIQIGNYLGWVNDPDDKLYCGGYFEDDPINYTGSGNANETDPEKAPVQLNAHSSDFHFYGKSTYKNDVVLTQPERQVTADTAYSYTNSDGKLEQINMLGKVHFREPGKLIIADTAYIPIKEHTSQFTLVDVIYRISLNDKATKKKPTANTSTSALSAWGSADQMKKDKPKVVTLKDASYSTCPPNTKACDWKFTGSTIVLNDNTGRGHVYNPILYVKNFPVFYMPFLSFPLNHDRQSGFLFPSFSYSSDSGFGTAVPYYFNLAPNYDATVTPFFYDNRGVLLDTQFRYLTTTSTGSISADLIPHDSEFSSFQKSAQTDYSSSDNLNSLEDASDTRTALHWLDDTTFNKSWTGHVDYNYVSDDYFIEDFPTSFTQSTSDQLIRQGKINYYGQTWSFQGLLQSYQTLHPVDQDAVDNQYARLPELSLSGSFPDQAHGLNYTYGSSFDYFWMTPNPGDTTDPTTGDRVNFNPAVSKPMNKPYGYITPMLQLEATGYELTNPEEGDPSSPARAVPMFDIDSGLTYQRETSAFGKGYTQTLEPRLYYLFVPYEDQNDLPVFDSVLYTSSYNQLFQANRFSSVDRVGDANQFSLGVTSRYIDKTTGNEKLSASVGDTWYLRNRHVEICTTDECKARDEQTFAPVVGEFNYRLDKDWSFRGDASWNLSEHIFEDGSLNFHYQPKTKTILNLGYTYVQEGNVYTEDDTDSDLVNVSQLHISAQRPITEQWDLVGSIDYNLGYGSGASFVTGAEYNSCCWAMRLLVDKELTGVENNENQYDTVYYIQFILKGMASLSTSSNPASIITSNVSGYHDQFAQEVV